MSERRQQLGSDRAREMLALALARVIVDRMDRRSRPDVPRCSMCGGTVNGGPGYSCPASLTRRPQ